MAYRDVVLADSPVDFYEMETGTGTDSGSGGRTLTLTGGVTTNVTTPWGKGWTFDGVNDTASMATWPTLTNAFTFEAWVKPNLAGVNDTPTIIRRDGTDIHLLRVRGSAIAVNPGQAEVYADGLTLTSGSSYRVDDGNWHHVVYTQSGNTARLYVDGVQRATGTTSQSTFSMGTGAGYIGSANGTAEWFKGTMDNVAVYNTALSATRITAHYDAGANGAYAAQPMTSDAAMPDATGAGNNQRLAVSEDAHVYSANANANYATATTIDSATAAFFKFTPKTGSEFEVTKTLWLYRGAQAQATTITVYRVNADWSAATLTYNTRPSTTLVRTAGTYSTVGWIAVDVTGADIGYGVMIKGDGTYNSADNATNKPYAMLATSPPVSVSPSAEAMTASAVAPTATGAAGTGVTYSPTPLLASATLADASVGTGQSRSVSAQPFYVSAAMPNPVVTVEADKVLDAEPMAAQAEMGNSGFAVPVVGAADAMTANATIVDAAVAVQKGPKIAATPMGANAVWKQPTSVNGTPIVASEVDDKFFQRVYAAGPYKWHRLNDTGSTSVDRMNPSGLKAYYEGVQTGQFNAPDGRHSVYFNGSASIRQDEGPSGEASPANNTLEFSFRTTKANEFLMVSADDRSGAVSNVRQGPRELFLKDGKIGFRTYSYTGTGSSAGSPVEFTGFRNLADGQWHTVVIRSTDLNSAGDEFLDGVEIYIDGKFEIRRSAPNLWFGFPDYIGSRPALLNGGTTSLVTLPTLPSSQNFVGDMSEVVFFRRALTEYEITRHYYDFMAWNPIEANPVEAFAFMTADNRGKGNQKRALYLWWDAAVDAYNILGGNSFTGDMNHDPVISGHGVDGGIYNLEDYKVFSRAVYKNYRDPVYDQPTLIDLDTHVDINDYDVIMFGDWPDEGVEDDYFSNRLPRYTADKERLIAQLRAANDKGIGLYVTHPRMAVDLGIIDRVELVPTLKESKFAPLQGNAVGLYDYGSAVKFPWDITSDAGLGTGSSTGAGGTGQPMNTNPAFLASKAFYYEDMNFNNKFRVRALVDGLTDIPSYMIRDAVYHVDRDIWGDTISALDLIDRRNGLVIGDEFIFNGTNPAGMDWGSWDYDGERVGRGRGSYAVPVGHVKAGTVVTTYGATVWNNQSEVTNPYRDYATTVVLQRGDVLAGKAVGGRIFVNFTEQPNRFHQALPVHILPGSEFDDGSATWPQNYQPETAAQRNWEFSETRLTASNTSLKGKAVFVNVQMPDGSFSTVRGASVDADRLIAVSYRSLFDFAVVPRWDMTRRGLWWVGRGEKPVEGEKRIAAAPMTAEAAMPQPQVVAQRDGGFRAEPMRALATMPKVKEDQSGDVQVNTLPMTAEASFTGFSRVISAAPMEAHAEFIENFDMVHATGEQVVLTLHGVDATLFIKEEN